MSFFTGLFTVMIVAIVFTFVYAIIKMGLDQADKVQRMKHGYPLKDGTRKMDSGAEFVDHRGGYGNSDYNQSGRQQ